MIKSRLKKALAMALAVLLLLSAIPFSASAAEMPVMAVLTSGEHLTNGQGKMELIAEGADISLAGAAIVISFDNTVIVPCKEDGTIVTIENNATTQTPCVALNGMMMAGAKWFVKGDRTALKLSVLSISGADISTETALMGFHYKLAEGKTEADLKKGTFKLETDYSDGSFLKMAFPQTNEAVPLMLTKVGNQFYYWGAADENNTTTIDFDPATDLIYPNHTVSQMASIAVTAAGSATSVTVPTVYDSTGTATNNKAATLALTAAGTDTDGDPKAISSSAVWNITGAPQGVTVSGSGKDATLTVAPGAKAGAAQVTVTDGGVTSGALSITIIRAEDSDSAVLTDLYAGSTKIDTEDTLVIPPQGVEDTKKTYSIKGQNAYGEEVAVTATWGISGGSGVSVNSSGEVTVTSAASTGDATLTAQIGSETTKTWTIHLTNLIVDWDAVDKAMENVSFVYGTANSTAGAKLPATGTATAGTTLNGSFSIKDPTGIQAAGDRTVTVVFKVTSAGAYQNVTVEKDYTVKVSKKAVTVKADNKTVEYYEDLPDPTFTVPAGALVGTDTENDLNVFVDYDFGETEGYPSVGTPVTIIGSDEDENDNYDVTVTPGKLTVTKATIKQAGFIDPSVQPGEELVLVTEIPGYMLASDPNNTDAFLKGALKEEMEENLAATVIFGSADYEEGLPLKWTGPVGTYNAKGDTYTYTGTIVTEPNFNAYNTKLKATMNVIPVTGALAAPLTSPVVVTKSVASSATSYTDFKLPASVTIHCSHDETIINEAVPDIVISNPEWDVPLNTLKSKPVGSTTSVKLKVPEWLTIDASAITVQVQITDKFPVDVTVTPPANITYGGALDNPSAVQAAIENGTDPSGTFTYQYTDAATAGKVYNSADKPTAAGEYTVTATLVSNTHAGSGSANFTINPKTLTDAMITAIPNETYNKEAHEPTVVVTDGTALTLGTDYTVTYENNVNAGSATAVVKGKGNYTGTVNKTFTIDKASLTAMQPTISGTAQVGRVLTANLEGVADGELEYQWKRDGTNISGATSKTYLLATADSNKAITVEITAKASGNYTGTTQASEAVTVEKQAISGMVTITGATGTIATGNTLTADITGITPAAAQSSLTYQWYRGEEAIDTATNATYTVAADDAAKTLKVVVTAGGDFQGTVEASVEVGKTALAGSVALSGTNAVGGASVGDTLTAAPSVGAATDSDYDIVWLRDGEPISGAAETTYTVAEEDQGKTVSVKLVGKGTYTGEVVSSTNVAIPAAVPAKPVVNVKGGNTKLTASWKAPASNGSVILGYTLTLKDNAGNVVETVTVSPETTSYEFTGLTNGQEYTVTISANSTVGTSGDQVSQPVKPKKNTSGGTPVVEEPEGCPQDDTCPISQFSDSNPKDWYHDGVHYCLENGLMSGYSSTTFGPKEKLSRAQMVQILYNKEGKPAVSNAGKFSDVAADAWYVNAVAWAAGKVVSGYPDGTFKPGEPVTREQLAVILYQYAGKPAATGSLTRFTDGGKASGYAVTALQWAVGQGIISGKGNGILDPRGTATRAEVATMLQKYCQLDETK